MWKFYLTVIIVAAWVALIAACTTADQERIATTIAEDEEVQDRLIAAGNVLETREAAYTPTPVTLEEAEATAVKATSIAERFIERTCRYWEEEAGRMLESTEARIHGHQRGASSGKFDPPEWEDVSWQGIEEPEFECVDHVATVAPHITATAATAGVIATAYAEECGGTEADKKTIKCLMGWEYDPERREREATAEAEELSYQATWEAEAPSREATIIAANISRQATMTAIQDAQIATATAEAEATADAPSVEATMLAKSRRLMYGDRCVNEGCTIIREAQRE